MWMDHGETRMPEQIICQRALPCKRRADPGSRQTRSGIIHVLEWRSQSDESLIDASVREVSEELRFSSLFAMHLAGEPVDAFSGVIGNVEDHGGEPAFCVRLLDERRERIQQRFQGGTNLSGGNFRGRAPRSCFIHQTPSVDVVDMRTGVTPQRSVMH